MFERANLKQVDDEAVFRRRYLKQSDAAPERIQACSLRVDADDRVSGNGFHGLFHGRLIGHKCEGRCAHCWICRASVSQFAKVVCVRMSVA